MGFKCDMYLRTHRKIVFQASVSVTRVLDARLLSCVEDTSMQEAGP